MIPVSKFNSWNMNSLLINLLIHPRLLLNKVCLFNYFNWLNNNIEAHDEQVVQWLHAAQNSQQYANEPSQSTPYVTTQYNDTIISHNPTNTDFTMTENKLKTPSKNDQNQIKHESVEGTA